MRSPDDLRGQLAEAREEQAATAEVLRIISRSGSDIHPALEAIVAAAGRLARADAAWLRRGEGFERGAFASWGARPELSEALRRTTREAPHGKPPSRSLMGRVIDEGRTVHVVDINAHEDTRLSRVAAAVGARTALATPIHRGDKVVGHLIVIRTRVEPFRASEIALVESFASQAGIAIENVRLISETSEALERQTAISEVLKVMSASAFELDPILRSVVESAARLCDVGPGGMVAMWRVEGGMSRPVAWNEGLPPAWVEVARQPRPLDRAGSGGQAVLERRSVHIPDVLADPTYSATALQQAGGWRTILSVPLLRDGEPLGYIGLARPTVRPFTQRQIELVEAFASQAVIAVENARLFNETQVALRQQTALSEILRAISTSGSDLAPVFDRVVRSVTELCAGDWGFLFRREGDVFRMAAAHGGSAEMRAYERERPTPISRGTLAGRVALDRVPVHIPDIRADPDYAWFADAPSAPRSLLGVPIRRGEDVIGVVGAARNEARPFTSEEIELAATFAEQAAIAIENVRLFNEIREKSAQLEVASRHKSEFLANMSHELRTPLNAIIGFTDVMLEEMFGPLNAKQKEYLEDVRNSGNHLLTLINDILDLSKIEAGRVDLELHEFSFPDALENALTLVRERATRHGITLASDVAADIGRITADERKLKQVLVNLLANAVKFTPDGGWVSVSAKRAEGLMEVAVRDTGIGIAPEDQERIFQEFQQVGRDPERAREGTGLGLTLAKRFVDLHGGRIWVESDVGRGSTFTFAIPVRQTALAEAKA